MENATVRAAAVSSLARFGALCDDLLPNILVLLARCQLDTDDEARGPHEEESCEDHSLHDVQVDALQ